MSGAEKTSASKQESRAYDSCLAAVLILNTVEERVEKLSEGTKTRSLGFQCRSLLLGESGND